MKNKECHKSDGKKTSSDNLQRNNIAQRNSAKQVDGPTYVQPLPLKKACN